MTPNDAYLCKASELVIDGPDSLLNRLLESSPDAHDLANTLHAATQEAADAIELLQVPARNLDNNIVQTWLEASARHLRDGIPSLVERDPKTQLGGDESQGIAGGFGGQGRGS